MQCRTWITPIEGENWARAVSETTVGPRTTTQIAHGNLAVRMPCIATRRKGSGFNIQYDKRGRQLSLLGDRPNARSGSDGCHAREAAQLAIDSVWVGTLCRVSHTQTRPSAAVEARTCSSEGENATAK